MTFMDGVTLHDDVAVSTSMEFSDEPTLDPKNYTVAWFAPLYIEARVALLMLDKQHEGGFETDDNDDYIYTAGSMGKHNVIIAQLPEGEMYGTASAAQMAAHVRKFFPNIQIGLLVGITYHHHQSAGLPNLRNGRDIRLGDVLVAVSSGNSPGVMPYELGKDHGSGGGFETSRGALSSPPHQSAGLVRSDMGKLRIEPGQTTEQNMLSYRGSSRDEMHGQGDDVLVDMPRGNSSGVVPGDYLSREEGPYGFELSRGGFSLQQSAKLIRSTISKLRTNPEKTTKRMLSHYVSVRHKPHELGDFSDPGQNFDLLYESGDEASGGGPDKRVDRPARPEMNRTRVWYGGIGSGDKLMRNRRSRDQYRDRYDLIGLEMEAAGIMNTIPVGVIRGVCDYGDHHKNKMWQPYAAAMAASYAKTLLQDIRPRKAEVAVASSSSSSVPGGIQNQNIIFHGKGIQHTGNSNFSVGGDLNIG